MKDYYVERPIRGVHILYVKANSAKEAKQKVDNLGAYGQADTDEVEGIEEAIQWFGKAKNVKLFKEP